MAATRSLAQRRSNHRDAIDLDFLPAVPGLERAPLSSRRPRRRSDLPALPGDRLARARTGYPRGADHRRRASRLARHIRRRVL